MEMGGGAKLHPTEGKSLKGRGVVVVVVVYLGLGTGCLARVRIDWTGRKWISLRNVRDTKEILYGNTFLPRTRATVGLALP